MHFPNSHLVCALLRVSDNCDLKVRSKDIVHIIPSISPPLEILGLKIWIIRVVMMAFAIVRRALALNVCWPVELAVFRAIGIGHFPVPCDYSQSALAYTPAFLSIFILIFRKRN